MLMVRCWRNVEHLCGRVAYDQMELFTMDGVTGCIEVSKVDVAGRRLVLVRTLGHYAAFVSMTHCVLVSSNTFPSVAANTICLGYHYQTAGSKVQHLSSRQQED
ncbi:hypothetical protein BAE44_0019525 [Dichanthelium oligosanthes]|uniref:DUF295 domain-containing protein n=1 Tax=Dichanthelium oligosanthes TaxID=888268 RepID=A0A1E5V373_9POAL|nr:hypothetical protein BAE44_0019525 [Dichanthelium oligosanthes]